jgi:tRNA-dihydrouridine synthase
MWVDFDLIDLNCGCPSTRIIGAEAGAYLLRDEEKISEIIKVLKRTGKPVTAKIRLGYLKNNVLEIARAIEAAGADALTIHARLSNHPYAIKADWGEIARVKNELKFRRSGMVMCLKGEEAAKHFRRFVMGG